MLIIIAILVIWSPPSVHRKCFGTDLAARLVKDKFIEPWIPQAPIPAAPLEPEGVSLEDSVPLKPVTGEQVQQGVKDGAKSWANLLNTNPVPRARETSQQVTPKHEPNAFE